MKEKFNLKKVFISLFAILLFVVPFCCMTQAENKDIVELAQENKDLSTLVTALKSAGLVDTLKGEGPYTVFAPTNEAFKKIPADVLDKLLKPESKNQLVDILTYHVAKGKIPSSEALKLDGKELTMLNGKKAKIEVKDGNLFIDGAKVIQKDIPAKNGVIHVIDTVMMP